MKKHYPINMKIPGEPLQMASNEFTTFQKNTSTELSAVLIIYDFQFLKVCTEQNNVAILIPIKNTLLWINYMYIKTHFFNDNGQWSMKWYTCIKNNLIKIKAPLTCTVYWYVARHINKQEQVRGALILIRQIKKK